MKSQRTVRLKMLVALGVPLLLAGSMFAFPANAAPSQTGLEPGEEVTFSVIGDVDFGPGGKVSMDELAGVGVTESDLAEAQMDGAVLETQASEDDMVAPMAVSDSYRLLATWTDNKAKKVAIRQGTSTWGHIKITTKHNATISVARTTTKFPKSRVVESSSSIRYRTPVYKMVCNMFTCWAEKTLMVRAIVNPTIQSDNQPRGIITTYCEGVTWCPDWVKNAVNA